MFIQTEETPNPATVKFIPGQTILEKGTIDFSGPAEASRSPLAARLFTLPGVIRVFLANDFVSVSKSQDTDWKMLKPLVLEAMLEHLSLGQPILDPAFEAASNKGEHSEHDDKIVDQIVELLDARVRPMVAQDGGDIVFDAFEDGVVYLHMRGACAGCPSSTATLKMGIENLLRHYIPEVTEVRAAGDR